MKTSIQTEKQILDLRLQGDCYKVIIEKAGVSSSTVSRILRKHAVILAMDRQDDLSVATSEQGIFEYHQNRYLARNLVAVEDELIQRSFKNVPVEKLQAIARNLRNDMQKLQDKREQQLEKAQEMMERDAEKRKEGKEAVKEQDEQEELAELPIKHPHGETTATPTSPQPQTTTPAPVQQTPQQQVPAKPLEAIKTPNPFNPTQVIPNKNPNTGETEPIQKAA